jgi:O-antigen ligase
MAATRNFKQRRTPVDIAIFSFFACCVISSFLSYSPMISIKGLRSPAFFFAFYFVLNKVRDLRFAKLMGFALISSCIINVAYSAGQIAVGRGLEIDSIKKGSAFAREGLRVGDVILEADGQKVKTPEDLSRIVDSQRGRLAIKYQRDEAVVDTTVSRRAIVESSDTGTERLGIETSPGRSFRVSGFYSHYETYAEVLQLIAAFAVGLLISQLNRRSAITFLLGAAVVLITGTLIMTSTRAAILGLAVAVAVIAVASARRRILIATGIAILILIPLALFVLQQSRGLEVLGLKEGSTAYRLEVWREAMVLIKLHPIVGIGKGSEGDLKKAFGLYDNGKLPPGHFHSTPIQVATWWGLPALGFYAAFMTIFFLEMWKLAKEAKSRERWDIWGMALGGLGVVVAFNVSSLVHFNFGDGEVVMTFWLLTGLVFAVRRLALEPETVSRSESVQPLPSTTDSHKSPLPAREAASGSNFRVAEAKQGSLPQ